MPQTKLSPFKPFVRVTILSAILAMLLIYLGINYHWGDYLKPIPKPSTELAIPAITKESKVDVLELIDQTEIPQPNFNPKIVVSDDSNTLFDSMNKEQMSEHCTNLLSIEIKDPVMLELAIVNCVMSNYQETFQQSEPLNNDSKVHQQKKYALKRQCTRYYQQDSSYTLIHRELLIGICVSDRLTSQ